MMSYTTKGKRATNGDVKTLMDPPILGDDVLLRHKQNVNFGLLCDHNEEVLITLILGYGKRCEQYCNSRHISNRVAGWVYADKVDNN